MILLLGASGQVGQAFSAELRRRKWPFIPLTRKAVDYSSFDILFDFVRKTHPEFIINAAGQTFHPETDARILARREMLRANVLLPQTIARVCLINRTPWGHVSSGSIYRGGKLAMDHGRAQIEADLNRPAIRRQFARRPERLRGFTEMDEPNCSFRSGPCNFYNGTKALAEEAVKEAGNCYVWRPQWLFHQRHENRNLLTELLHAGRIHDQLNSLSQLDDFVRACLELWERRAAFGIYNVVNPGVVTTRRIVQLIQEILQPDRDFAFHENAAKNIQGAVSIPSSSCILDAAKLLATGIQMRPVEAALQSSLRNWQAHGMPTEPAYLDTPSMSAATGADAFERLFAWQI